MSMHTPDAALHNKHLCSLTFSFVHVLVSTELYCTILFLLNCVHIFSSHKFSFTIESGVWQSLISFSSNMIVELGEKHNGVAVEKGIFWGG